MSSPSICPVSPSRRRMMAQAVVGLGGAWGLTATRAGRAQTAAPCLLGVVPYLPAQRLAHLYAPLLPTVRHAMCPTAELVVAPDYQIHLDRLQQGRYDLVADALLIARLAQRDLGHIPLVCTAMPLEPVWVVPVASPVQHLSALLGGRVCLSDPLASPTVIGLHHLRRLGWVPGRDVEVVYTGSHANALHRVLAGEGGAALVSVTTLRQIDPSLAEQFRVLHRLPTGVAAVVYHLAPRWADRAHEIRQTLLDFARQPGDGTSFLTALGHEGLRPITASELRRVDPWLSTFQAQRAALQAG